MMLSTFDGEHIYLFKATLQKDGTLKGDYWSGKSYHTTWTAKRDENAKLPDGKVRNIHTSFRGPGTGVYYERFVEEFKVLMDKLLLEEAEV